MKMASGTNAIADDLLYRNPSELLKRIQDFMNDSPRPIGNFMGFPVYVDHAMSPAEIKIQAGGQLLRFSVDHPYIKGTKIEAAARGLTEPNADRRGQS